jgi:hypothetical protein
MEAIREALDCVDEERAMLRREIAQFEEFCEIVRLTAPDQSDEDTATEQTRDIRETYQETVMDTPDFKDMYHETLEEHLPKELSPASATAFLSE